MSCTASVFDVIELYVINRPKFNLKHIAEPTVHTIDLIGS